MTEFEQYGILPFLCPICHRKRVEYHAKDGALFVRCTKCGADHDTICDAALEVPRRCRWGGLHTEGG